MKLNETTKLFEQLNADEKMEMFEFCESVVLKGNVPYPLPAWADEWIDKFGNAPHQKLLIISTALVQFVMMSLLKAR